MDTNPFKIESDILHEAAKTDTAEAFDHACQELSAKIPPMAKGHRREIKPRIAFFLSNANWLAHSRNLHTLLRGLDGIGAPLDVSIIGKDCHNQTFANEFRGRMVALLDVNEPSVDMWTGIQAACHRWHADAMVHVSAPQGMAWAANIRCAKKHVFWAQKWHGAVQGVDGYIFSAGPDETNAKHMRGALWHPMRCALPDMRRPDLTGQARELRKGFGPGTLYGTFCRDVKYSPEFLTCVRAILDAEPTSQYVYASRKPVPGMHPRAEWLGWVDTALWCQVIDVFLDSFPFAGGHVAYEAMAHGKPVVMMDNVGEQNFPAKVMKRMGYGLSPTSAQEYIELARSKDLLKARAVEQMKFYQTEYRDEQRMAQDFVKCMGKIL